jgi:hypothetical protein
VEAAAPSGAPKAPGANPARLSQSTGPEVEDSSAPVLPARSTRLTIGIGTGPKTGQQRDNCDIEVLRFALGGSLAVTRRLSLDCSLGLNNDRNLPQSPSVVPNPPAPRVFKMPLDLRASSWEANASTGLVYHVADTWDTPASQQEGISSSPEGDHSGGTGRMGVQWLALTNSVPF